MGLKYYFVSASNVEKANLIETEYGYKSNGKIKADEFFNGVPDEFRKIVLVSSPSKRGLVRLFDSVSTKQNSYYAHELISGFQFCKVSQNDSRDGHISLINVPFNNKLYQSGFYEVVSLDLIDESVSLDDVKMFILKLKSNNLLESYFSALNQLFFESKDATLNLNQEKENYFSNEIDVALKKSIRKR